MRAKIISIAVGVLVVALAVGFRFLQLMPYPKGEFNWVDSPNMRHRAYVCTFTDMKFFTGRREVYRLKVEWGNTNGARMLVFEQDVLQKDARTSSVDLNKLDEFVTWYPDSSHVVFKVSREDFGVDVPF